MVTLQILVLSFLVRIQVAQLNDLHLKVVFFLCFSACVARDVRAEHFAMLGGCHDASINTHPVPHGASPTLAIPARPLSSIVVPPDSHLRLVEPI